MIYVSASPSLLNFVPFDYEYVSGAGDLDECNGRFGVTLEYPKGIYHYYVTEEFPFISRYLRGTPDTSFQRRKPGSR